MGPRETNLCLVGTAGFRLELPTEDSWDLLQALAHRTGCGSVSSRPVLRVYTHSSHLDLDLAEALSRSELDRELTQELDELRLNEVVRANLSTLSACFAEELDADIESFEIRNERRFELRAQQYPELWSYLNRKEAQARVSCPPTGALGQLALAVLRRNITVEEAATAIWHHAVVSGLPTIEVRQL